MIGLVGLVVIAIPSLKIFFDLLIISTTLARRRVFPHRPVYSFSALGAFP
jgi:hypothetical protein